MARVREAVFDICAPKKTALSFDAAQLFRKPAVQLFID